MQTLGGNPIRLIARSLLGFNIEEKLDKRVRSIAMSSLDFNIKESPS